jgi:small subunit ribosomal protein S20
MANHASAVKRNRQRIKRTANNRAHKSALRSELKKARGAITAAPATAAQLVREASGALDKASSRGTIPFKRASRLKGRLAAALHRASTAKAA